MKSTAMFAAVLALAACAPIDPPGGRVPPGLVYARFGQTVTVGGPRVTPLALVEDSRCPQGVQCVWAGQLRITARVASGTGSTVRELTSGKPISVADGSLLLADVQPAKRSDVAAAPGDYRLGFRFEGGL
jgi:hypothetical protein